MVKVLYAGAYARVGEPGISVVCLGNDGSLQIKNDYRCIANPSYLARGPSSLLYAVSELMEGGEVWAFHVDRDGGLIPAGHRRVSGGAACHVAVDNTGRFLAVANYLSGIVDLFRLERDGAIAERICVLKHKGHGPIQDRQEGAHAHCVAFHPSIDNRMLIADLGSDRVWLYEIDHKTRTAEQAGNIVLPPGSGPRHIVFCPDTPSIIYVICELGLCIYTVRLCGDSGIILDVQNCMPENFTGIAGSAAIKVDLASMRVYASTRVYNMSPGEDCITSYSIDPSDYTLKGPAFFQQVAPEPRDIAIVDDHLLAACQSGGRLMSFEIDRRNGIPSRCVSTLEIPGVCCICE